MSVPVSPVQSEDETMDVDQLITEVQARPPLWDKNSKSYSDRNLIRYVTILIRLWDEIYENVIPNWDELAKEKKKKSGLDVQKKWKNLKDCFSRELNSQKNSVSGQSGTKKRKYYYFDQLSFLIPVNTPRDTSGNVKPMEKEDTNSNIQLDEENSPQQDSRRLTYKRKTGTKSQKGNTDFDDELLNILRNKKEDNYDEYVSFSHMLIPMLRKLNDSQKLYAKMEILQAMDRAKNFFSVSQPAYPTSTAVFQTVPQPIPHHSDMLAFTASMPNTSATYINFQPETSFASKLPRNIVINNNKTITNTQPVQENCNDYIVRFAHDLQSPESVVSQDSLLSQEDYYDVSLGS